uniref:Uncharacterized protein n=1 Tax=Oryza sativa subsp. japonica TaxID=39947 RepID=Q5Z9G4_ORYSJ|nr:hypothetical protein [Oryza sativa Japonica Group]
MVVVGRSLSTLSWMYIVSDMSHAGFKSINFGSKNGKGEQSIVVPKLLYLRAKHTI